MKEITQHKYSTTEVEPINRRAKENPAAFVAACEKDYHDQLDQVAQLAAKDVFHHQIILLAGPSASGKTTTAFKLAEALARLQVNSCVVSLDDFYRNRDELPREADGSVDLETVDALDLEEIGRCMEELLRTGKTQIPQFDFTVSKRGPNRREIQISPSHIVIIEGIHGLNPEIARMMDSQRVLKLYVSLRTKFMNGEDPVLIPKAARLIRRMVRDSRFRATRPEETVEMWESVCRGEREYINPYRDLADIKIDSTLEYEPCVFHYYLEPFLKDLPEKSEARPLLERLLGMLQQFHELPIEIIPKNSLLREFVGK